MSKHRSCVCEKPKKRYQIKGILYFLCIDCNQLRTKKNIQMTQKQINVDFTKIKSIPCECGCLLWDKRTVAKKISGIIIGSTQDTIAHIDVLVCSECKKISPDQENIVHLKIEL